MSKQFKVESGIQLFSRFLKKPGIERFYPILFENGPKQGDIIEVYSDENISSFLSDIICQSLLPAELGGAEAGILVFSTNGNLDIGTLVENLKSKLNNCLKENSSDYELNICNIDNIFQASLQKLFHVELFDVTQFHVTIQNLENILLKNCNISFVIFDTLTAFYWSEQSYKICRMDLYIKSLLKIIKKITKDYKITVLYSRPEYFCKDVEKLDTYSELQSLEELNYRIHIAHVSHVTFAVVVRTHNKQIKKHFNFGDGFIQWL